MKKSFLKLFAIVLCCLFVGNITASAQNDAKKQEKAEKKRLKAIQDSLDYEEALGLLKSMSFVIKAEQLIFKNRTDANPNGNTNFLSVQHDKATLQFGTDTSGGGSNGLGGISLEGTISSLKTNTDKKGNYHMEFDIIGAVISARANIKLPHDSKVVSVNISPNFDSENFSMYGSIVDYANADIFQGRTF